MKSTRVTPTGLNVFGKVPSHTLKQIRNNGSVIQNNVKAAAGT